MANQELLERRKSMSNHDFRSILEKLTLLEGDLTPTNVKHGLNKQQKSVKQMPALFKPKTQKILGGDPNAKNPMSGYMVGADESKELEEDHQELEVGDEICVTGPNEYQGEFGEVLEFAPSGKFVIVKLRTGDEVSMHVSDVEYSDDQEDVEDWEDLNKRGIVSESDGVKEEASVDVLTKVKNSFSDYLKSLEDSIKTDKDLIAKKKQDLDLKKKELKDLELQTKKQKELEEDPTQEEPGGATATAELINPTYGESESNPVKTFEVDATNLLEIHGDEVNGFEIRRGDRSLPTRFNKLSDAEMALDMFKARMAAKKEQELNADYLEEK